MLIRSQDKKRIANIENCSLIKIIGSCETSQNITVDGMVMDTYSTEEKAIKVLDMIQEEYLKCNCQPIMGNYGFVKNSIFQMPQDNEV